MAIFYGMLDTERFRKKLQNRNQSIKRSLLRGEEGERKVRDKLSELDDNYHILCGIRIVLDRRVTYRGKKDLKEARTDFIVVSRKGIVLIEVKDWSDEHLSKFLSEQKKYGGYLPHAQVDRYGLVLYIELNLHCYRWKNPPLFRVLLATNGNMQYDSTYEYVTVKDLNNINDFIETRYEKLSDEQVHNIINSLKMNYINSGYSVHDIAMM